MRHCLAELQDVLDHYEGEHFALLTLDLDSNKQNAIDYINSHSYDYTEWGYDTGSIFGSLNDYNGNSNGIPQSIIVDLDGNCRYGKIGAISSPLTFTQVIDEFM